MCIITSVAKGGYVFGSVSLSVCLFVDNITQKSYEWIGMKFYGVVLGSIMKNWLNFGCDLGAKNTIIVVAWPDCGLGNDPEPLGLAFHHTKAQHFYSGQYGRNDLPQPRRYVLSECF